MEHSCILLQKNETFSHSFTFFAKERCILLVLISCQKLEKKNGTFLLKNGKERNVPNGKESGAQP